MKTKSAKRASGKMAGFINKIDPSLTKYQHMDLFKEKIEEVAAILNKAGLPKAVKP